MSDASEQVLNYAIPGNDEGGRLVVFGNNKNAEHILFFCGGWPDDCGAFSPIAKRLAAAAADSGSSNSSSSSSMLCGVTCLPGYDTHHENFKANGYTFDEAVASLREACKMLRTVVSTNPKAALTGVFHDWGSAVGAMFVTRMNEEFPGYYADLVYFDVLPPAHKSLEIPRQVTLKKAVVMFSYTSLFATCNAIQRYLSFYLAVPVLTVGFGAITLLGLKPTRQIDADTFHAKEPRLSPRKLIYMQYPYFNMYKILLSGGGKLDGMGFNLPVDAQKTPVLFLYGVEKNINYHDDNVIAWLEKEGAKDGSKTKVVPVENAGHWLYLQQEDVCYEAVKKFVLEKPVVG